jgi:hypothetical protein
VKLPNAVAGTICEIINGDSAQTIDVWPATGDKIQGGSSNAVDPTSIAAGTSRQFYCIDAAEWLRNIPTGTVLQRVEITTTSTTNNTDGTEVATGLTGAITCLSAASTVRVHANGGNSASRASSSPTVMNGIAALWRTAVTSGTKLGEHKFGYTFAGDNPPYGVWYGTTAFLAEDSPATKSATTYVVGVKTVTTTTVLAQFNNGATLCTMILEEIAA